MIEEFSLRRNEDGGDDADEGGADKTDEASDEAEEEEFNAVLPCPGLTPLLPSVERMKLDANWAMEGDLLRGTTGASSADEGT